MKSRNSLSQPANPKEAKKVGLARALSKLGYCSRSRAFELIRSGKVQLNGTTPRNPETSVRLGLDRIEVGELGVGAAERRYLVLNKPPGLITTAADELGRDTVYTLLGKKVPWLAPVGRLDRASEGLLLMTNDSEWAARVTDPQTHLDKTYHVQLATIASPQLTQALVNGIEMPDGERLRVKSASVLRLGQKNSWLEIVLDEGKNRQIRRLLDALGVRVLRLVRVAIGPVQLQDLPKGKYRELSPVEKRHLDRAMEQRAARNAY